MHYLISYSGASNFSPIKDKTLSSLWSGLNEVALNHLWALMVLSDADRYFLYKAI